MVHFLTKKKKKKKKKKEKKSKESSELIQRNILTKNNIISEKQEVDSEALAKSNNSKN